MKKIIERACVICREKKPKNELFRFLVRNGKVELDKDQKGLGRGFYICSRKCWEDAQKKKRKIRIGSDAKSAKTISLPKKAFEEMMKV